MNAMMKDLKDYGAWTLACHFFSKATGIWEPYQDARLAGDKEAKPRLFTNLMTRPST